jgi:hypothetical protein
MKIRLCVLLLLNVAFGAAWAATCNVGSSQSAPQPGWVNQAQPGSDEKFYGVGVADIAGSDIPRALGEARSRANAELAQSIRVNVSSSIKSSEGKLTENGKTAIRSSFEAITDSVANLSLQSVAVDGQWMDARECRLWLRVSLSRAEAQRAQKLELSNRLVEAFETQMQQAEQASGAVSQRERALAASAEILGLIEPALVPTFSADAARIRIDASRALLSDARRVFTQYGDHLGVHLKAFGQMTAATAAGPRRASATTALTGLQAMLAIAPQGMPGLALPFNLPDRMLQLFGEVGAPCMARKWVEAQGKPVAGAGAAAGPSCTPAEVSRERRQLYLAGRPVHLGCTIVLDGQSRAWDKVCAAMQDKMVRDGASVVTTRVQGKEPIHTLTVSAVGTIKKRTDPDTQAILYRFEGVIATAFKGPDQIDIVDHYEGLTGWNPVSAAMTADVLALNVAARLDASIAKHWER